MRPADRCPMPFFRTLYPWDKSPVIETQREFHLHANSPADPANDADDVRIVGSAIVRTRRHEVRDGDCPAAHFVRRFQDERLRKISAARLRPRGGREQPASIVFGT